VFFSRKCRQFALIDGISLAVVPFVFSPLWAFLFVSVGISLLAVLFRRLGHFGPFIFLFFVTRTQKGEKVSVDLPFLYYY
jgi:hypothetical protein